MSKRIFDHIRKILLLVLIGFSCGKTFSQDSLSTKNILDEKPELRAGGRIYLDFGKFFPNQHYQEQNDVLNLPGEMKLASAEAYFKGILYQNIEFTFKVDFKGNDVSIKQAFIGYRNIPFVGTFRVGYQYEPFRFSALSSSKYYPLINKPDNYYFSPKRNMGLVIFNDFFDKRFSYQIGLFQNGSHRKNNLVEQDGFAFSSRIVILPYFNPEKNRLLHLGIGYNYRKPKSREFEIHIPRDFPYSRQEADPEKTLQEVNLFNFETIYIHHSLYWQSEYSFAKKSFVNNTSFSQNIYGQIGWILTGEIRNYSGGYSGYDRIRPKSNFNFKNSGTGAWELAARYSETKLAGIAKETEIAAGINWYLNPNSRLMLNYSKFKFGQRESVNGLKIRAQIDF